MGHPTEIERLDLSLTTPAGNLAVQVEVPTGFVPVTAIVPALRRIGERAMALEEQQAVHSGAHVSCREGCAACCRMLVPVSPPEAYALKDMIERLPGDRRQAMLGRIEETRRRLANTGLLDVLSAIAESDRQWSDDEMEPVNRAYYALRMPCPFLEDERCSIYADRPAACRELLVTSPAELCQDLVHNAVRTLPVPLRISTVLSLLWSQAAGGPLRFIPLPLAWDWADRHGQQHRQTWQGARLFEWAADMLWKFLSREFHRRGMSPSGEAVSSQRSAISTEQREG
jgi:Fe-S-cluster containining protein